MEEMWARKIFKLFLIVLVLIGMSLEVSSKPLPRSQNSDILSGVDFLSIFMHSATRLPQKSMPYITTPLMRNIEATTLSNEDITIFTTSQNEDFFVTTKSEERGRENEEVSFVRNSPSAIISNSNRNEFSIEESGPITINRQDSSRIDSKVKRKSEDLLAIGANPDYIAQQQSRLHREHFSNYNRPYLNRQASRSRSVSYSAVIQSLPSPDSSPEKPWKETNPVIAKPNNPSLDDYDYTESYPLTPNISNYRVGSTAESKDYYVTRKYNPGEFNESGDKNLQKPEIKKSFEPGERNWAIPEKNYENFPTIYNKPEQNYEIDEAVSVMTNGRTHGVQANPTEKPLQLKVGQTPSQTDDNQKVGYVVEGRNYRKYRVEERTSDGFIVGEYGVVSNNDGSLRGVRYTADGTINPRVIYDALMKFLSL